MSEEDDEMFFSRLGPPPVDPVEFEGKRYEQVQNGELEGVPQRTGCLTVTDIASDRRLATVEVYAVAYDPDEEEDVQDVFFVLMALEAAQRRLLIENERHERFHVAIDSLTVTPAD